jgi:hypothetical protein
MQNKAKNKEVNEAGSQERNAALGSESDND